MKLQLLLTGNPEGTTLGKIADDFTAITPFPFVEPRVLALFEG